MVRLCDCISQHVQIIVAIAGVSHSQLLLMASDGSAPEKRKGSAVLASLFTGMPKPYQLEKCQYSSSTNVLSLSWCCAVPARKTSIGLMNIRIIFILQERTIFTERNFCELSLIKKYQLTTCTVAFHQQFAMIAPNHELELN